MLHTLLDQRDVTFSSLIITIHKSQYKKDKKGETTFGFTDPKITRQAEVYLYLKYHMSDIHFFGTLLHALGRCFADTFVIDGHTEEWLLTTKYEPPHDKTNKTKKMACAPSEDSDQPGHPPSLIRVFAVRMKKAWALSYPLRAQRRLWSDWVDAQADLSLRCAHMPFCWFCHWVVHILCTSYAIFAIFWKTFQCLIVHDTICVLWPVAQIIVTIL